jgi:hypothetical protein
VFSRRRGQSLERLLGGNNAALTKDEKAAIVNLKVFIKQVFEDVRAGRTSYGAPYNVLQAGFTELLLKRNTREVGFNKRKRTPIYERSWVTRVSDWVNSLPAKSLARQARQRRGGEDEDGDAEMEEEEEGEAAEEGIQEG